MNEYEVTMRNKDGETDSITVEAKNIKVAQHKALEDANSGILPGSGWLPIRAKEVKQ